MLNRRTKRENPIPMWGGIEATVNRVGDRFQDQFEWSGHVTRPCDLDRIADLGVRALRIPVLWERVSPEDPQVRDWAYPDAALGSLRELGVEPIVGLVHHGSGPRYTDLLDPEFAEKLAVHARAVAERYPWVQKYTPVNEPLTTARFSALYGHWYPHAADTKSFGLALINQVRATVLAMAEIRKVNPHAQLVQTDDLGKIHSTPELAYQAALENERRWLGWDLLCGRLSEADPMWEYLTEAGIDPELLRWHQQNPCPPDVIGVNHYISSERFLDDRLEHHAPESHGGNGKHVYADVLAARVREEGCDGFECVLSEAWERYHLPIAITECHLGCTREEQMRWLVEAWEAAHRVRDAGADIVGFTVWSMTGAYDWNFLLTKWNGHYEPGVFDLRAPTPRPTALAKLVRSLSDGEVPDHPALHNLGWWARPSRFEHPPIATSGEPWVSSADAREQRVILIAGGTGALAKEFARECDVRGLAYRLLSRDDMDIAEPDVVARAIDRYRPWAVINAAGYGQIDAAERYAARCYRENTAGPAILAGACRRAGVRLVTFSSDLVFDGENTSPYTEDDAPCPQNVVGRSKREAERCVLAAAPDALVVRTSGLFGPTRPDQTLHRSLWMLGAGQPVEVSADHVLSPTYAPDLVAATLDLMLDDERGVWHLANQGETTWFDLVREVARRSGLDGRLVSPNTTSTEWRPSYTALASSRGWVMPSLDQALERYLEASRRSAAPASRFLWI